MGDENKLLLPWGAKPIVAAVVEALLTVPLSSLVVVVGHEREQVEAALQEFPVVCAVNENFAEGMASSLRRGIEACGASVEGYLVALGDMPEIDAVLVKKLCERSVVAGPEAIVLPTKDGQRGHPVLFGRRFRNELLSLPGDRGARAVVDAHPESVVELAVDDDGVLTDVDTPAAYRAARP